MGEKTEKIEKIEKVKGKTMNEIIIEMEKGTGSHSQVSRILDSQTEIMAKRLERSNMEQLMAESERKRIEEEHRLRAAEQGEMPPTPQPQQAPQEAKNILDAVRVGLEAGKPQQQQQGSAADMAKSIVEAIKIGVDMGKAQNQPTQQTQDPMQIYKEVSEIIRPFKDEARAKEKEANEVRYRELESKIVNPVDYIKNIKEVAKDLGMSSGLDPTIQLKLADMAQVERFETMKIQDAREERAEKREDEKEGTKQLYGLIGQVVGADGVVGKLAAGLGSLAKNKIEGRDRGGQNPTSQLEEPKRIVVSCPGCQKPIKTVEGVPLIVCQNCDAVLSLQQQPRFQQPQQPQVPQAQTQEQSSITQSTETQAPPPASPPTSEAEQSTDGSQPSNNQPDKTA